MHLDIKRVTSDKRKRATSDRKNRVTSDRLTAMEEHKCEKAPGDTVP